MKVLINAFIFLSGVALVAWLFSQADHIPVSFWLKANLKSLIMQFESYPIVSYALFFLAHLLASTFSIPGSCTFLNILAGAVFGFTRGSFIVYSATVAGAYLGYFLGSKIRLEFLPHYYQEKISSTRKLVAGASFSLLVLLRLSPLLPFGILNLLCGYLKLPLKMYMITTTIGVFFDVFLLSSIGALLNGQSSEFLQNKSIMVGVFLLLFLASVYAKLLKNKLIPIQQIEKL